MKVELFLSAKKQEDKDKIKSLLIADWQGLEHLSKVLERKIRTTEPDYDNPSWSHKQADQNGYNRALKEVLALIKSIGE